jgi:phage shock protein PspC (stress-responsive transcriptional regulator)
VIGGVAAGLAEYFNIDTALVRLLFVLFAIFGGGGLLVYIILWIAIPEKPFEYRGPQQPPKAESQNPQAEQAASFSTDAPKTEQKPVPQASGKHKGSLIGGLVLITLGCIFLVDEFIPNIDFGDLWPVILIAIGIGLLFNTFYRKRND